MPTVTMYKGSKFRMVCTNKELFTCTVQYYSTQEVEHLFWSHTISPGMVVWISSRKFIPDLECYLYQFFLLLQIEVFHYVSWLCILYSC